MQQKAIYVCKSHFTSLTQNSQYHLQRPNKPPSWFVQPKDPGNEVLISHHTTSHSTWRSKESKASVSSRWWIRLATALKLNQRTRELYPELNDVGFATVACPTLLLVAVRLGKPLVRNWWLKGEHKYTCDKDRADWWSSYTYYLQNITSPDLCIDHLVKFSFYYLRSFPQPAIFLGLRKFS